jgi:hypothetical protein
LHPPTPQLPCNQNNNLSWGSFQINKFLRTFIAIIFACTLGLLARATDKNKPVNPTVSPEEMKLYTMIMDYRKANNLPVIPLSRCLTHVAQQHCLDLDANPPDESKGCNMHSWSDKGKWSPCCYTDDHKQAVGMWKKPGELTSYRGSGYEIAHGGAGTSYVATAESALHGWKNSSGHNVVILNEGIWKDMKWNAIGIAIYKGYSVVWFGTEVDKEGKSSRVPIRKKSAK